MNYLNDKETEKANQGQATAFDLFKIILFKNKQETLNQLINGPKLIISSK